ncbi:MAG: hypothetical protein JWO13_1457 [Acidobacteriales bacterium]|nr:hypothetical protein [Terriglobales bacterium]
MFISIHDLEVRKLEFAESFAPGVIDLGPDLIQRTALKATGRAELLEEHHGGKNNIQDIRIVGGFSTQVELKCARCIEPVVQDLSSEYDLLYRPAGTVTREEEVAINEAETEIGYYTGEGLLLEDTLKEQILLSVPIRVLCKEDCIGLCPQCGQNRNLSPCDCAEKISDPRWAALAEIKEKLKH